MQKGDFVRINYIGRLESGEVFDLTDEEAAKKEGVYSAKIKYGPIPVIIGAGFVIPGLDNALKEMDVGEKRSVEIQPKDAFGERNAKLVQVVPQKAFRDQKVEPKQGMIVDFSGMKGRIQSVSSGRIRVDFNNPLAGKILKYDVEIVDKIEDQAQQIKGLFEFFGLYRTEVEIRDREAVVSATLPSELKQKLSSIIHDYVNGIEKVTYQESYTKKESK